MASPSKIPANWLVQTLKPVFCSIATHAPFRHRTLEDLGRILVQDTGDGHSRISCEVVGDPAVPMTAKRGEVFKPLGLELAQRLEARTGTIPEAQAAPPPPSPPGARDIVESRLIPCDHCGTPVALLIFAPEATDPGQFEVLEIKDGMDEAAPFRNAQQCERKQQHPPCKRFQLDESGQVPVFLRLPIIESAGEPTYR